MLLAILLWLSAAYMALSVLLVIGAVGKPRKPITSGGAVAVVVMFTPMLIIMTVAGFALI